VRIALALKGLDYDYKSVHLRRTSRLQESYRGVGVAPGAVAADGDHADAVAGHHGVPGRDPPRAAAAAGPTRGRARVRALALDIACEIHPLNNLRVLRYLVHR
jgi:maleylpyruvate isomerase